MSELCLRILVDPSPGSALFDFGSHETLVLSSPQGCGCVKFSLCNFSFQLFGLLIS